MAALKNLFLFVEWLKKLPSDTHLGEAIKTQKPDFIGFTAPVPAGRFAARIIIANEAPIIGFIMRFSLNEHELYFLIHARDGPTERTIPLEHLISIKELELSTISRFLPRLIKRRNLKTMGSSQCRPHALPHRQGVCQ